MKAYIILFMLLLPACKTPQIYVAPELKDSSMVLPVKGRQGLQLGQKLSFGEFNTSKIKRGWTQGYDFPFMVRFQGVKEKFSFQLFNDKHQAADVYCAGKFRSMEIAGIGDYFDIVIREKNHFAGTIISGAGKDIWDFLLYNPDGRPMDKTKAGFMQSGTEVVEINGIRRMANGKSNWSVEFWGYEFIHNGEVIGTVETINNGNVWLKNDLPESQRLLLAGMASALLLRSNLEEMTN